MLEWHHRHHGHETFYERLARDKGVVLGPLRDRPELPADLEREWRAFCRLGGEGAGLAGLLELAPRLGFADADRFAALMDALGRRLRELRAQTKGDAHGPQ